MKPPKYAQKNAQKALKCINQGSNAMTKKGRERARQLAKGGNLSQDDLKSISQFERHKKNASYSGYLCDDKGAVAWLGWGNSLKNKKGVPDFSNWAQKRVK